MKAVVIMLLGLLSTVVAAEEKLFTVGVEMQPYPPYFSIRDGEYRGYARDLLDAFAKAKGYRFSYQPRPVKRLLEEHLSGELDFKFPDNPSWKTEEKVGHEIRYSQSIASFIDGTLVPRPRKDQGKARIKTLGTLLGFTPWPYLADIRQGRIRLTEVSQIDALLKMLMAERVDAVYLNVRVAEDYQNQLGGPQLLVFDPNLPHDKGDYYLSSLNQPQVIAELNAFLRDEAQWVDALKLQYRIE